MMGEEPLMWMVAEHLEYEMRVRWSNVLSALVLAVIMAVLAVLPTYSLLYSYFLPEPTELFFDARAPDAWLYVFFIKTWIAAFLCLTVAFLGLSVRCFLKYRLVAAEIKRRRLDPE